MPPTARLFLPPPLPPARIVPLPALLFFPEGFSAPSLLAMSLQVSIFSALAFQCYSDNAVGQPCTALPHVHWSPYTRQRLSTTLAMMVERGLVKAQNEASREHRLNADNQASSRIHSIYPVGIRFECQLSMSRSSDCE